MRRNLAGTSRRHWAGTWHSTGNKRSPHTSIFLREVQAVWPEVYPFADPKALSAARALGLPGDAQDLAELVPPGDFTRLVAALVRSGLAKDHDRVVEVAAGIPD